MLLPDQQVELHDAGAEQPRGEPAQEDAQPGVSRGQGRRKAIPARRQATTIHRNWPTPAIATAQAST